MNQKSIRNVSLLELARQAFCGLHPMLWDLMKDRGYPTWRSNGCTTTESDAREWILLLTILEIEQAVLSKPTEAMVTPDLRDHLG